jgi:lysophospholipase L1-like esterase
MKQSKESSRCERFLAFMLVVFGGIFMFGCNAENIETTEATVETQAPIETEYPLDQYNLNAYTAAYWQGDIMYQESVMVLQNEDGTIPIIPLLYKAKQIVSVRSSDLATEFKQGKDYALEDGKLRILPGSAIPVTSYAEYYPSEESANTKNLNEEHGGGYILYSEGAVMHKKQIAVTYTHEDTYTGEIPAYKGDQLPKLQEKLKNGEAVKIAIYGDSISTGRNSSAFDKAAPMAETWFDMFIKKLQQKYPDAQITYYNPSVSGKTAAWGNEQAMNLLEEDTDLCIIGFGANDGTRKIAASAFKSNIQMIMSVATAKSPDCEFVLISTMLPNPETIFAGVHKTYLPELLKMETTGVVVADVTTFHESLLQKKRYYDMSGNNVNHPNDFMARSYAQVIFQTVAGY